jgi:UDP-N-acetylmuramoylalanine--D-glutamate ligase
MGLEEFKKRLKGKNIHVVGITGAEGSAILRFLISIGVENITGHDFINEHEVEKSFKLWHHGLSKEERNKEFKEFRNLLREITVNFRSTYLEGILKADLTFVPQSWFLYRQNYPILNRAQKLGITFFSMTKLYLELTPCPVVAVTGTVGKGTVCALICKILERAGFRIYFGGNETWRQQVLDKIPEMRAEDVLVIEVSNRQLRLSFQKGPYVAVITNIYPNHLDEHSSFKDYIATKGKILERQREGDFAILNYDNSYTRKLGTKFPARNIYFSLEKPSVNKFVNTEKVLASLKLPGKHNRENALAAAAVAKIFKVKDKLLEEVFATFSGLPGRLEFVKEVDGANFYDDIKSTTPAATIAALKSFKGPVILIAGGKTKGLDYAELASVIKRKAKLLLILKSHGPDDLATEIKKYDLETIVCQTLEEAIKKAKKASKRGDIILLSPAAAFFYSLFIKKKTSFRKLITTMAARQP